MTQDRFWQNEKHYRVFLAATNLVKFIIIDIDLCHISEKRSSAETSTIKNSSHFALADVEVARESDFGINDLTYRCVTHFGNVLQVGDYCLGYDLASCTYHDDIGTNKDPLVVNFVLPDVILVKQCKGGGVGQDGGDTKTTHTKVVDREPDDEEDGKKKSKRGKKKDLSKDVKEKQGRGYRGAKKQNEFESQLSRMGFLSDIKEKEDATGGDNDDDMDEEERAELEAELENDDDFRNEIANTEKLLSNGDDEDENENEVNDDEEGNKNILKKSYLFTQQNHLFLSPSHNSITYYRKS